MKSTGFRRGPGFAAAVAAGSVAWLGVFVEPAVACSCVAGDMDGGLAAGAAVAIVTRTDDGGDEHATFRVEDSIGPALPERLDGMMDTGASCQPYVAPDEVAALAYQRRGDRWHLGGCSKLELGPALQRAQGDPEKVVGGKAVAVAAGSFGGSRLAAVDREGNIVAWSDRDGEGEMVAVCPEGRTVVVFGRGIAPEYAEGEVDATVHDATMLAVRRTVPLTIQSQEFPVALRCADPDGREVGLLTRDGNEGPGRLLRISDDGTHSVELDRLAGGVAVPGGFIAVLGDEPPTLVRLSATGERRTIARLAGIRGDVRLAIAPDGRTAALRLFGPGPGEEVRTYDLDSGRELGRWEQDDLYVTGLAWTASGKLVVRHEVGYHKKSVTPFVLDREAREQGRWAPVTDEWGGRLDTVGEESVVQLWGQNRPAEPSAASPATPSPSAAPTRGTGR